VCADPCRSDKKWLEIFKDAGLEVIKEEVQVGMPEELFVVRTSVKFVFL
jgi:protein N-terminal methyltransferase